MPTTESWVLDGVTLTSGNFTMLELDAPPPKERAEWITAADSEAGALVRQPLHENRVITMKLRVAAQASMNAALDQVGAIVDKLRLASRTGAGIDLVWTPANSSRARTFDVLDGEVTELPITVDGQGRSWFDSRPIFTITLTCAPYHYGTETLTSTASSSTPITTLEITGVTGDVPALGRLIITDTATQNRRHFEWGAESLYYNSGTSLIIDSDSMSVSGLAGVQTAGSGYDPNAAGTNVVRATLYSTPLAVASTGDQTHVGQFRIKARVSPSAVPVYVRLAWQVGDGPWSRNSWAAIEVSTGFYELDLGTIHIPPVIAGTQRWRGQVEMYTAIDATTADLDYLLLIPVEAGYGKARARYAWRVGTLNGYDRFKSTTAGNALNARVAPVGGTWTTSGDTTDFLFSDGMILAPDDIESVSRENSADTTGRFARLSTTSFTDTEVGVTTTYDEISGHVAADPLFMGVLSRYVDASNYVRTGLFYDSSTSPLMRIFKFETRIVVAGVATVLASQDVQGVRAKTTVTPRDYAYRIVHIVYATGRYYSALYTASGGLLVELNGQDSRLATAGSHATGARGLFDSITGSGVATIRRYYGDFYAAVPSPEPIAIYSGRSAQVRYDDTLRLDSAGTYYGRPESYNGSRFLVQPGTSRVVAKARRLDVDVMADANVTDATQIQVGWTPRGLVVPR